MLSEGVTLGPLLDSLDDGVVIVDAQGVPVRWNETAARALGRAELTKPTWLDRAGVLGADGVTPLARDERPFARALQGESVDRDVFVKPPGALQGALFAIRARPLRDADGVVVGALVIFRPVSERQRSGQLLRESEEQFRLAFDLAPIGMALVGLEGRFLRVNHALSEILGYSPTELLRIQFQDITHPDDLAADLAALAEALRGEVSSTERRKRYVRKDGAIVEAVVHGSVVRDEQGAARHFIAQIEDRTAQKKLEAQLVLADRMSSVSTLASGIAHEINNPLAYVTANLEMIAEELRELAGGPLIGRLRELTEMANQAREGTERVRLIVRGLKSFAASNEEQRVPLDVRRVAELAVNLTFNEVRLRARLVPSFGEVPAVEADEGRLAQVCINLIMNAAQAIPEGHAGDNEIQVATRTDADGRAVIEVKDSGPGIAADVLHRIFDPFFTTRPVGAGQGLGLSICHGIVTSLGGEIHVRSEPGRGATFCVSLPPVAPRPGSAPATQEPPTATKRRGRVLVVDDEVTIATVIRRILRDHEVIAAGGGHEALHAATDGAHFDLILCDLMMPDMTGMELHERLRLCRPDLVEKMVFMTGGVFTTEAREFLDAVPNERLEKPFDIQHLRALVQRRRP